MIKFRCQRCHHGQEVPKDKHFEKCPKCKEKIFMNYYEHVQSPKAEISLSMTSDQSPLDKKLKGGQKPMVTEKKEKKEKKSITEVRDDFAKQTLEFMKNTLELNTVEINKVHTRMWRILHNK